MAERLTVEEASATYAGAMRNVQPVGPGICRICHTFIGAGWDTCFKCGHQPEQLDAVVPITYSEHLGQVHLALRNYKDGVPQVRTYARLRLIGILWKFVSIHEPCVAAAAGVQEFDLVTTVPSSDLQRDDARGHLRALVEATGPLADRYERVLCATGRVASGREYNEDRYVATRDLDGERVLLIDDTWTAGGHAQSAAAALKAAGASEVALVVIGRHVRPEWEVDGKPSAELLDELPRAFHWDTCCVHSSA